MITPIFHPGCRRLLRATAASPAWIRCPLLLLTLLAACTWGPEEERWTVEQVVQVPDTYEAFIIVSHDRFRRPTGLSTFPDGGRWRYLEREVTGHLVHAGNRRATPLFQLSAPDNLRESFDVHIRGLGGDSVIYLAMTGCPSGGECHPDLSRSMFLRVDRRGDVREIAALPPEAALPGVMLARRSREVDYVRLRIQEHTIRGRFAEDTPWQPLWEVGEDGFLVPLSTTSPG